MAESWTIGRLLATTTKFLAEKGASTPRLDAELMLAQVLNLAKVQLYVNFERELGAVELDGYRQLVRRRAGREPVAYILGHREFYGLNFKTTTAALIPRPETEHLVDAALALAQEFWLDKDLSIADIGCGTGAIALALARNLPRATIAAVDISREALELARENAAELGLDSQVTFYEGNLLTPLAGHSFQLLCANLPYIPSCEMEGLMPEVCLYEPHLALDGGSQGLTLIEELLAQATAHLTPGGHILLEIWPDSLSAVKKIASNFSFDTAKDVIYDLAGHPRIVVFKSFIL